MKNGDPLVLSQEIQPGFDLSMAQVFKHWMTSLYPHISGYHMNDGIFTSNV